MPELIPGGEYSATIDSKGRVVIPVPFRPYFADGLWLTHGLDGGVDVLTEKRWKEIKERLDNMPAFDMNARRLRKLYYSPAQKTKLDKQGRVLIPPLIRRHAGLRDKVVILSTGDHLEIWDENRYFDHLEKLRQELVIPDLLGDI